MNADKFTLAKIAGLHPVNRSDVEKLYYELLYFGIAIRIAQGIRTFAEQDELFRKGGVTNAKAGQSFHNYGLAIDFCLLLPDGRDVTWDRNKDLNSDNLPDWKQVVDAFKSIGFSSGGDWSGKFKDYPHLERTFGLTWQECLRRHDAKDFIEGTEWIRI